MATIELIASATDNTVRMKRERQYAFLQAFRTAGNRGSITQAAEASQVRRHAHYDWMAEEDGLYAFEFKDAQVRLGELLEEEAVRRATVGRKRYKFTKTGDPIKHPELCVCGGVLRDHTDVVRAEDGGPPLRGCVATNCADFVGQPYYELEASDTLLIVMMKAHMPERHRERVDMKGNVDHSLAVQLYMPDNAR